MSSSSPVATILPAVSGGCTSPSTASAARRRATAPGTSATAATRRASRSRPTGHHADHLRPRHRRARVRRRRHRAVPGPSSLANRARQPVPRRRCCSRTSTGTTSRVCRSSRRRSGPTRCIDVYGPRQDDGPLGEVFAGVMRPPYFPITPAQLGGTVTFLDTADDDFAGQRRQGARRAGCATPTRRSGTASSSRAARSPTSPTTARVRPRRRRRLHPDARARALRRRRRAHPRRAAHGARVRDEAALRPLHDRLRGARRPRGRRARRSCCSTTARRTATTRSTRSSTTHATSSAEHERARGRRRARGHAHRARPSRRR